MYEKFCKGFWYVALQLSLSGTTSVRYVQNLHVIIVNIMEKYKKG